MTIEYYREEFLGLTDEELVNLEKEAKNLMHSGSNFDNFFINAVSQEADWRRLAQPEMD
jgi:preprotein translocase subunit SecA